MPEFLDRMRSDKRWLYGFGGVVLVAGGYLLWKRRQQANASTMTPTVLGDVSGVGPDATGASGGPGGSDISSLISSMTQTISDLFAKQSADTATGFAGVADAIQARGQQDISSSLAAPTVSAGSPSDTYSLGQQVAPGETIVERVFSPVYGWLNETSKGGIYTGGGGSSPIGALPNHGSYLGYVGDRFGVGTPDAAAEMATHGQFGPGGLSLLPGGGYTEINTKGERYAFGA